MTIDPTHQTPVPMEDRQWTHDRNVLLNHPRNATDSFTLLIKAMMLISRVKRFNVRYKAKFYAGDEDMQSAATLMCESLDQLDPRETTAFQTLDQLVSAFFPSFPPQSRTPIQDETVDSHLYTACTTAHL